MSEVLRSEFGKPQDNGKQRLLPHTVDEGWGIEAVKKERSNYPRTCVAIPRKDPVLVSTPTVIQGHETLPQFQAQHGQQGTRIAIKSNGRILLLDPHEVVAVHAQGNHVILERRTGSHLLHESISTMAEKLKPYGFIRIHRSVLVNRLHVEEIRAWPTGEYGLRVTGGKEYTVTRTYKEELRNLAELWIGSNTFAGGSSTVRDDESVSTRIARRQP